MIVRVLRIERGVALPLADGGEVRAVVWPGVGARHRSMHHVALRPGGATHPQAHPASEAVYYIVRGEGHIDDLDARTSQPVRAGSFVFITPGTRYRFAPSGAEGLVCIGGPCPPDAALYAGLPIAPPAPLEDPR
jgi:mannose-6-phosphate isomerase-like protein (cupin superfamily)